MKQRVVQNEPVGTMWQSLYFMGAQIAANPLIRLVLVPHSLAGINSRSRIPVGTEYDKESLSYLAALHMCKYAATSRAAVELYCNYTVT